MQRLSWRRALAWRMERHHLVRRAPPADLLAVAARICGLHAQVMSSAELTVWARIDGLEREAVSRALWDDRSLVKLWAMRGTLHLLPASELGLWLGGLATYDHYLKPVWTRNFEITPEELEDLIEAIAAALDGRLLTREQLGSEIARATKSPTMAERVRGSWGPYLKPASFRGQLCFAPDQGRNVRFTRPDSWVRGGVERIDGDAALLAITRRYLAAFAPAEREDLARWWSVSPARAGAMLKALGADAVELDVDGDRRWMLVEHAAEAAATKPKNVARLLPGFDQWVIGASRSAPAGLDPRHKDRVYRPQGWISPVLLVNGRMEGTWRHERKGTRLNVEITPFTELPNWAQSQAEREAERLAQFLDSDLQLDWKNQI